MSVTPPEQPPPFYDPAPGGAPRPSGGRSPVVLGVLVGVLVFALIGAGVAGWKIFSGNDDNTVTAGSTGSKAPSPAATSPASAMPSTDPALAAYYDQKLDWKSCGDNECATMKVPLDYTKPDGTSIGIAVLKVPAGDPSERVGSLVVNPGGPGGSGLEYAAGGAKQFGKQLADHYDIVGFDPRGVGKSDPLKCVDTAQMDALLGYDPAPETAAGRDKMDSLLQTLGNGCLTESGELARHVSTKEAARDMDILRATLGAPKLDYLGASYGTFLGATYAEEFPTHVGRFVLDGAIDPALSNEQLSLEQAKGFETALRAYVADCVAQGDCILGNTVDEGTARIKAFLDQVETTPLPTDTSRMLTSGWANLGIWLPLYVKDYWPYLTSALKQAFDDHNGSQLMTLADAYASRGSSSYTDNSMEVLYAVNCLDHDDYIPTKDVPAHFAQFEKVSPTFGKAFAFGLSTCSDWPIHSGQTSGPIHAKGAPPIVVIGTTRDPATPLEWAQALSKELDSGTLITRNGDGHTGFQQGNSCVDDAVEAWLIKGTQPKPDLHC
ncbi:MAG TPA: alpha/beta hydrolase [Marmoricola sp.]|nr:alpha/beta hydrolase [Marmoricola sp.]